jgi:hypothetical protein
MAIGPWADTGALRRTHASWADARRVARGPAGGRARRAARGLAEVRGAGSEKPIPGTLRDSAGLVRGRCARREAEAHRPQGGELEKGNEDRMLLALVGAGRGGRSAPG